MKILYLTTSFPPFMEAHTIRNIHYMNSFVKNGDELIVCAPIYKQKKENFAGILDKRIQVIYTKLPLLEYMGENLKLSQPNGLFMKLYNYFINYVFPDSKRGWENIAYKGIHSIIDLQEVDCIISASGSYTAHILAGRLVRENPKIKWIAEYGDPWGVKGNGAINKRAYRLETKLLNYCSKVIFTTQETVDIYKKHYPFNEKLYEAIYGGYDTRLLKSISFNVDEPISIAYIGVAYKSSRNLENIIYSLRKVDGVIFSIIGRCSEHFKTLAKKLELENVVFVGQVSYDESIQAFGKHDAFIIIGNDSTSQIPSKIYNYIASGRPIIYISQMKDKSKDPTNKLLKKFGGVIYCEDDVEDIQHSLLTLTKNYNIYFEESQKRAEIQLFKDLSWAEAGQRMVNVVHAVISPDSGR